MKNVSIPRLAVQFITYAAMDKSKVCNGIVKRISGGTITRDTLAKSIISKTVSLGLQHASSNNMLGKRSAEIVNQVRSVLFDNTQRQVKEGVAPLIELIVKSKGQGEFAQKMAAGIGQFIGPSLLQNNALERVLVALKEQPGGENALKLALENALGGFTGGKMISATFMSILKRAILDNPDYKPTSFLHHMAAWKLHQNLTSDPSQLPPAPLGLHSVEAIAGKIPGLVTTVCHQLDNLQKFLQLPLSEKELSSVYTECWPSDLNVAQTTSRKDFIKLVMMAHATDQQHILDNNIALLSKETGESFQRQHQEIKEFLSKIPEPEIKIAQNWSGDIEAISAYHHKDHDPSARLEAFMASSFRTPVHHPDDVASYFADGAFIKVLRSGIDLNIDNSHQSYARWVSGFGNQLVSQAKQMWTGQHELAGTQLRQLGQLSEMVDNNPLSLLALTRYLIPENITHAVQNEIFEPFLQPTPLPNQASERVAGSQKKPIIIAADNVWMKVGEPQVSFAINKQHGVNLDISIKWPVSEFSKQQEPVGLAKSRAINSAPVDESSSDKTSNNLDNVATDYQHTGHISTQVNINMLFNDRGLEKQTMKIGKTSIALHEKLTFLPADTTILKTPVNPNRGSATDTLEVGAKTTERLLLAGVSKMTSSC
ncbi:hypothetical protein SJI19_11460 [Acerihabitans sp. TG2]|uniref:hypothetical protein n=1 Tax=Acerihabitans sp. TG2 TaxID=3096008 RepID=UPI002B224225|nr:hypothetical protein [Acerihabitans sp. TG2]MEA9391150.1 hypothetical protein [Acerihabitans sp. TG2]